MRKVGLTVLVCSLAAAASLRGQEADAEKPGSVWENRLSAWEQLQPGQKDEVFKFAEGYKSYLKSRGSAQSSTAEIERQAKAAGFSEFTRPGAGQGGRATDRHRRTTAPSSSSSSAPIRSCPGSRLIGTHHDSPHIDLKARPFYTANGFTLFKTIYYGGIKKYQWANRPLALIGRIDTVDGKRVDVSIGLKEGDPVFVIPDNAPHSDNESIRSRKAEDVFGGEELDPVAGSIPGKDASVDAPRCWRR